MNKLLEGWVAIVSKHEKGFWCGDLYDGNSEEPEAYFTTGIGASKQSAVVRAQEKWPYAKVLVLIDCPECMGDCEENGCDMCGEEGTILYDPLDEF